MRHITLLLAAVATIVALAAGPAAAQPEIFHVNERIPITSFDITNPCTGGTILFEGTLTLNFVLVTQEDGSFAVNHANNRFQAKGVSDAGAKYLYTVGSSGTSIVNVESAQNITLAGRGNVIRQGEEDTTEDDFSALVMFHVTQNANGEFTAVVTNRERECR